MNIFPSPFDSLNIHLADSSVLPSLREFDGWFNIPNQYDDGRTVLRTQHDLPVFEFPELFAVHRAAAEWFASIAPGGVEPFDPFAENDFVPRLETDDRTLIVDHVDFARLSLKLLRGMQLELLTENPLWRIVLLGDDPSCSILIYPTLIRFGDLAVDFDETLALERVVAAGIHLRAKRQRASRTQFELLSGLLPSAVKEIQSRQFLIVGVLDNYRGDQNNRTAWLLSRGVDPGRFSIASPGDPDRMMVAESYRVDNSGRIISEFTIPKSTAFCVTSWIVPSHFNGPLDIVSNETGERSPLRISDERQLKNE